jgi:trk system potassium uptake protein TrkH
MRLHIVLRYVAFALILNALFMIISSIVSVLYSDSAFMPLLYSGLVTALFGIFPLIFIPSSSTISNKEGHLIVVSSWLLSCVVGMLPYIMWGGPFNLSNAWFESVSGFTTTGSTILENIEALPHGLLFWRAATHWIGGIGIIIFVLSVLPFLGIAEIVLYRSEISSMAMENFRLRARTAIRILAGVYGSLTLLETILLLICGMNVFDAVTHAFATIATGGFSTKNASIAAFNSPAIEVVILIFMILSGIHFAIIFSVGLGRIGEFWRSTIVRYYLTALAIGTLLVMVSIHGTVFTDWITSLRFASFQIISVGTSTGFATTNSALWPMFTHLIIIFFTLQCACSGSTSGGIKTDRIILLAESFQRKIKKLMHPNAVIPMYLDKQVVRPEVVANSILYIVVYLVIVLISTAALSALGMDNLSAFSGTVAAMGNVGPGLASVGSMASYNQVPELGKWILSVTMLLGRLEIYAFFLMFTRAQWRRTVAY